MNIKVRPNAIYAANGPVDPQPQTSNDIALPYPRQQTAPQQLLSSAEFGGQPFGFDDPAGNRKTYISGEVTVTKSTASEFSREKQLFADSNLAFAPMASQGNFRHRKTEFTSRSRFGEIFKAAPMGDK